MAANKQNSVRNKLRNVAREIGGAAVQAAEAAAIAELQRVIDRVSKAPAHVVAAAGIVNGMPAEEINARVMKAMDDAGL